MKFEICDICGGCYARGTRCPVCTSATADILERIRKTAQKKPQKEGNVQPLIRKVIINGGTFNIKTGN